MEIESHKHEDPRGDGELEAVRSPLEIFRQNVDPLSYEEVRAILANGDRHAQ